jgi:hypothetical protein
MRITGLGLLLPLLLAAPLDAGGLNTSWVAAEAGWVAHLDVDALVKSAIGRHVIGHRAEFAELHEGLDELRAELGLDLRTDLRSVTLYALPDDPERGLAVFVLSSKIDALVQALPQDPAYEKLVVDGYEIHAWKDKGKLQYGAIVPLRDAAGGGPQHAPAGAAGDPGTDRLVVIADEWEPVAAGLRVIDGTAASMAGADGPSPRGGSILFATATTVPIPDDQEPASAILRKSDSLMLDLGEREDEMYVVLHAGAGSETDARDIADVIQGLIAISRLVAGEHADLAPMRGLADRISVRAEGRRVAVELGCASAELVEHLERLHEHMARESADDDDDNHDDAD